MKKTFLISMLAVMLGFSSCSKENELTVNQLGIYPIVTGYHEVYADQTIDSIIVVATQLFTFQIADDAHWMSISEAMDRWDWTAHKADNKKINLYFTPYKGTSVRTGLIKLSDGDHTVGRPVLQKYWLDIRVPDVQFAESNSETKPYEGAYFVQEVKKDTTVSEFVFNIYDESATLSTTANWVEPKEYVAKKGLNTVKLSFDANATKQKREAVYDLTTKSGITTKITLRQTNE